MARDTKKCIKNFIDHVNKCENEEDEHEGNGFDREYQLIQDFQLQKRKENAFPSDHGKLQNNLKKNRYKDILPYDDHRVVLGMVDGDPASDYINASKLMGVRGTGGYIASQGPLASTVSDFWRMAWEYNVEIIFMACRIVELGKIKCKQYWNDQGKSDDFGDITVFTESEKELNTDFIQRDFLVTHNGEERRVIQFHYSGWPDHGIPRDPAHIRDLIGIMRQSRQNDEAPLLVHCSAGCGRTGAIIAIDFVWTLLEEGRFDETFDMYELICNFREQRMSIVQTPEQYALVNQVLRSLCEEWMAKMASHTYENVDFDPNHPFVNVITGADQTDGEGGEYVNVESTASTVSPKEVHTGSDSSVHSPTGLGPEIIEVKRPSERLKAFSANSYENVTIQKSRAPAPQPPPSPGGTVHKTLIQIGPSHSAPVQEHVAAGPGGARNIKIEYQVVGEGKRPHLLTSSQMLTNKTRASRTQSLPEYPETPPELHSRTSATLPHPGTSSANRARIVKQMAVSDPPTEFGERLPRVTGPVTLPTSWDKS